MLPCWRFSLILGEVAGGTVQRREPAALVQAAAPAGRRLGLGSSGRGGLQGLCGH